MLLVCEIYARPPCPEEVFPSRDCSFKVLVSFGMGSSASRSVHSSSGAAARLRLRSTNRCCGFDSSTRCLAKFGSYTYALLRATRQFCTQHGLTSNGFTHLRALRLASTTPFGDFIRFISCSVRRRVRVCCLESVRSVSSPLRARASL
jgi:hypothetical protein